MNKNQHMTVDESKDKQMQDGEKETNENGGELNPSYEYRKVTKKEEEKPKEMPAKKSKLRKELKDRVTANLERTKSAVGKKVLLASERKNQPSKYT